MSKAAEIAKVTVKGSFHLLWGLVIFTVISLVAKIIVARFLGSDLYGLFGIVLVPLTLIGIFRVGELTPLLSVWRSIGEGTESEIRRVSYRDLS
jgi:O-antigen/teichoic acid export membrane protein